jgi:ActR/RegA family two-component response regulator
MDTLSQDRPRVLIVDDQPNWREALCEMLDLTKYEIETAASYDEAKRRLRQRAFHVLVADQRLVDGETDNIQGILLLDEVNELRDGTQAIIVTGYPTIKDAKAALRGHQQAHDYLLKSPEEGGPFNIGEYRERVKEAAEKAASARQTLTLEFSVSALVSGLTYDQIAEALHPGGTSEVRRRRRKVVDEEVNSLLHPFQPLAHGMGRAWLSEAVHIYEILCWSRRRGKAALVRIGIEQEPSKNNFGLFPGKRWAKLRSYFWPSPQRSLETYKAEWLKEDWHLVKNDEFVSTPFRGISYLIDGMGFDDFVSLVSVESE